METCDVVVAGSGPTGLMLAGELALAGVHVVLLEHNPGRTGQTRAMHMQPRAVEELDLRGLLGGVHERAIGSLSEGYMAGVPIPLDYGGWSTRYPNLVRIPQPRVEDLLEERLAGLGTQVRYRQALTGLVQDDDGVVVTVSGPDGDSELRAAYLVGCDGGSSAVRKLAGIGFPGTDPQQFGVAGDVLLSRVPEEVVSPVHSAVTVFGRQKPGSRFVMLIALGESGRFRAGYVGPSPARPDDPDAPVTKDELEQALQERYGDEVAIAEVLWASRFTDACRQADRYRAGRVFVAGDAAHIHLPASSQGMGLGIQDAMNLGWKLAVALRGQASDGLLDTYHVERHAATARVLEVVQVQGHITGTVGDPSAGPTRRLLTELTALPEANRYLAGLIGGLDIRLPIDGCEDGISHELLGARMPDVELDVPGADGHQRRWASELFHSGHGVLLTTDPAVVDPARRWAGRVDTIEVPELPLPGASVGALLVRPDGYVCWTAPGGGSVEDALARWFGPPAAVPEAEVAASS